MTTSRLISFHEAKTVVKKLDSFARTETLPLQKLVGRVCARTILSEENLPQFPNSSMDGFAVQSDTTRLASLAHPVRLSVVGTVFAGDSAPLREASVGTAWEIMTGAPLPSKYDAVVKIEDVQTIQDSSGRTQEVVLHSPVELGQNCREAGEDFQVGTSVIGKGDLITPEHVLALAALGISSVEVVIPPRVGIISTGNELQSFDAAHSGSTDMQGKIRNSTAPFLLAVLESMGVKASFLGVVSDEASSIVDLLKRVRNEFDVLITTGGVSMGKHDFVFSALESAGAKVCFHKITMRPGKPNVVASFSNGPVVFGLPGNPVSTVVGLRFLFEPFLRKWLGRKDEMPWRARLTEAVEKPQGLTCFFKAKLSAQAGHLEVQVLSGQASFMVKPLLEANSWAVLPEGKSEFISGDWVEVYPLHAFPDSLGMGDQVDSVGSWVLTSRSGGCC